MQKLYKFSFALTAPFLIAGCGMPIGIQIASLLADSVSFITTEKTLTDHGLSAITKKDCKLLRSVKNEEICQNPENAIQNIASTELPEENTVQKIKKSHIDFQITTTVRGNNKKIVSRKTPERPAKISPIPEFSLYNVPETKAHAADHVSSGVGSKNSPIMLSKIISDKKIIVTRSLSALETTNLVRAQIPIAPKLYFVIASYHHKASAYKLSRKQQILQPVILKGVVRGKPVYRVAIGPIRKERHKLIKASLIKRGFLDNWELTTTHPPIELAALD